MDKEMTVQEAIEFCKSAKRSASGYGNTYMALEKLPQIIALLKRGEEMEKLWELAKPDLVDNIKQKYLKEAKQTETNYKRNTIIKK